MVTITDKPPQARVDEAGQVGDQLRPSRSSRRILLVAATLAACGGGDDDSSSSPTTDEWPRQPHPPTTTSDDGGTDRPPVGDGSGGVELEEIGDVRPARLPHPAAAGDDDLYVVEQGGKIQRVDPDAGDPSLFLDISRPGRRPAASRDCCRWRSRPTTRSPACSTSTTPAPTPTGRRSSTEARVRPDDGRSRQRPRDRSTSATSPPTTTAGWCCSAPTATSTSGWATVAGAGDPERNGPEPARQPARQAAAPRHRDRGRLRGRRLRAAQPLALLVRPQDRRPLDRRRRPELSSRRSTRRGRPLGRGRCNFGWSAYRGDCSPSTPTRRPPARSARCSLRPRRRRLLGHRRLRRPRPRRCRRSYGRYLYGDFCQGQLRSFTADPAAASATTARWARRCPSLSSFGEDARRAHLRALAAMARSTG